MIIDISKWQWDRVTVPPRKIDFDLLASKVDAVICKCGQGNFVDYAFEMYMRELKARGVPRGSYWFYDNRVDPKTQARNYSNYLRAYGLSPELPAYLDFEFDYPTGKPSKLQDVYDFIVEFQRLEPGVKVGIYTGYYFWTLAAQRSGMRESSLQWFGQFPLWLAWYTHDPLRENLVQIPAPWKAWDLWQYTDRGDGFGAGLHSKELDLNKPRLSVSEWLLQYGQASPPAENKSTMIMDYDGVSVEYKEA